MPFPIGLFCIIISLVLFYSLSQKERQRRAEKREKLKETRQQYLESLLRDKDSERENPTHNS